ncbi:MAG: hypothetical protein AABY22_01610 [Nanoarchaeota archaeon]
MKNLNTNNFETIGKLLDVRTEDGYYELGDSVYDREGNYIREAIEKD